MKGRTALRKLATVAVAVMLVTGGIVTINPHTEQDLSPVEEGDAALVTGAALVGAAAAGAIAGAAVTCSATDCLASRDPDVGEKQETIQNKIDLYQTANQQESVREVTGSITENGIRSSDPKMKMEAIQALGHAAEQDMTLAEAKAHVSQIVNNRTSIKEINIYNAWSNSAETAKYVENRSDLAPNIGDGFANYQQTWSDTSANDLSSDDPDPSFDIRESGDWTVNLTLQNGSQHTVTAVPLLVKEGGPADYNNINDETTLHNVYPGNAGGTTDWTYQINGDTFDHVIDYEMQHYVVDRNQSSDADTVLTEDSDARLTDVSKWTDLLNQVEQQQEDTVQTVHGIADRQYSAIKAGEVQLPTDQNPYYASEMGAAENYSTEAFTASWLSSQGVSNPEDWQNLDSTTITLPDGRTLVGQPLGLDDGQMIKENQTYNVSDTGTLTIATPGGTERVTSGNFTVSSIDGLNGANPDSLTFEDENMTVSNISDYRRVVDWMQEQQAESEAREKTVENNATSGGGGLLPSGLGLDSPFSGDSAIIGLIVLGIALLAIVARVATGSN